MVRMRRRQIRGVPMPDKGVHMSDKFCPLNLAPEELIEYTSDWTGERFPDVIDPAVAA